MTDVTPQEAIEAYLTERSTELSASSIQNHRYQLKQFRLWCERVGVSRLQSIEPIHISRFRRARADEINSNTMYNQLSVVRLFLRFVERMGWSGVPGNDLSESIVLPTRGGKARDRSISADRAGALLDELERYEYASIDHVILALCWTAGVRIGALRSLDLKDLHLDEMYIELNHRPETHTPLKNKVGSEREVNLHGWVCSLLKHYIEDRRIDSTDDFNRSSLLTTRYGRMARSTIRRRVYRLTDCSDYSSTCDCADYSSKCEKAVSPHDIRRSSITAWLDQGHDPSLLASRFDVSERVISDHYDVRSEQQKRELRRDAFNM
ncbi:tyrosine-type recombinase/integrase [Natrialbaceae archaeon AArc-T1-2]|uniref:tyrosine-type recombinase/integrase n=1 Tax=Natrialbaceae archaeon AArc-T1-2 TaxID=3053904 RepID=UPI00255AA080|nr:tyrosine-type recombinase/integrase [Natrialbaceae archaeon AArc-T1-2]WIV66574.1 tyrosine-type recombinase/integrase [Natrialbaceae archaeon AArc-T1-2]